MTNFEFGTDNAVHHKEDHAACSQFKGANSQRFITVVYDGGSDGLVTLALQCDMYSYCTMQQVQVRAHVHKYCALKTIFSPWVSICDTH